MNPSFIRTVKERNDIIDVARNLGLKVPSNGVMQCLAPEKHGRGDKHPSMRFDKKRQRVKCWGCDEINLDVIGLVQRLKRIPFTEAVKWLAARAKLEAPATRSAARGSPPSSKKVPVHVITGALNLFAQAACKRIGRGGHQYLVDRGINPRVIASHYIGYVDDYKSVQVMLPSPANEPVVLQEAGLSSFYNFGKHQIPFVTFPYLSVEEGGAKRVRAIKARATVPVPDGVSKYLCTSGTIPFLYNAEVLDSADRVFICEGEIDTLTLETHGYQAVGVPGWGGFKAGWAELFTGKEVFLVLDADAAGARGARSIAKLLDGIASSVRKVSLPRDVDVNELFKNGGAS